jgi:hypothetical protein
MSVDGHSVGAPFKIDRYAVPRVGYDVVRGRGLRIRHRQENRGDKGCQTRLCPVSKKPYSRSPP